MQQTHENRVSRVAVRDYLCRQLTARSAWRRFKADERPDDARNAGASDTLSKWARELAAMPLDDPRFAPLAELLASTGRPDPLVAFIALGITCHEATSRVGFQRGAGSLAALLDEWTAQAAGDGEDE